MLVITRRPGEALYIGDDIRVEILSVDRNHVRVGITAPKHIRVNREEIVERIRAEREAQGAA